MFISSLLKSNLRLSEVETGLYCCFQIDSALYHFGKLTVSLALGFFNF